MARSAHTGQSMVGRSLSVPVVSLVSSGVMAPGALEAGDFQMCDFDGDFIWDFWGVLIFSLGVSLVGDTDRMASSE